MKKNGFHDLLAALTPRGVFFAVVAATALILGACKNPAGKTPNGGVDLALEGSTYAASKSGVVYTLTITPAAGRAVHFEGDGYTLSVKRSSGDITSEKISSGTIKSYASNGYIILQPSFVNENGEESPVFNATIGTTIISLRGTITFDDGTQEAGPGSFGGGSGGGFDVSLSVKKDPDITGWPTWKPATYGTPLSALELNTAGSAEDPDDNTTVQGSFDWDDPSIIPTVKAFNDSEGYKIIFTPIGIYADSYNTVSSDQMVKVNKATPASTPWPTTATVNVGEMLSTAVFNVTRQDGVFELTVPDRAAQLSDTGDCGVKFIPSDDDNYNELTGDNVYLTVVS